jgi:hypothetical protein
MKPTEVQMPERLKDLPFSKKWGLPVPFFVDKEYRTPEGEYEFRMAGKDAWITCVNADVCWVCGKSLGTYRTFGIGPMCTINRIAGDPPCHRECAEYAAKVCPFMLNPNYARREKDRPPQYVQDEVPGTMIPRNPGVSLLWTTKRQNYHLEKVPNGWLFRLSGEPHHLGWWREGRSATREEVVASFESGYPILLKMAQDQQAAEPHMHSVKALEKARDQAYKLLPQEAA